MAQEGRVEAVALRRWSTAALVATLGLLVLGGLLRALVATPALGDPFERWRRGAGMLLGVCALGAALTGLLRHRREGERLALSLLPLLPVGLQGYLGTRAEVSPDARPFVLAAHLALTLVLVGLLLVLREASRASAQSGGDRPAPLPADRARIFWAAVGTLGVLAAQIVVGAALRGRLDLVATTAPELARGQWLEAAGVWATAHRQLAGLAGMGVAVVAMLATRCTPRAPGLARAAAVALVLCVAQCAVGLSLWTRALPPDAQALHLPAGVLVFAAVFGVALRSRRREPAASAQIAAPSPDGPVGTDPGAPAA